MNTKNLENISLTEAQTFMGIAVILNPNADRLKVTHCPDGLWQMARSKNSQLGVDKNRINLNPDAWFSWSAIIMYIFWWLDVNTVAN